MKRIIGGKRYDTEKAELIAETAASCSRSDYAWFEESLYRTAKGYWFTAGTGGPMTRYAVSVDMSSRSGGSAIHPLTSGEARQWLEDAEEWSALDEHFADELEDA